MILHYPALGKVVVGISRAEWVSATGKWHEGEKDDSAQCSPALLLPVHIQAPDCGPVPHVLASCSLYPI